METIRQIEAFRSALNWRRNKRTVGLVATMGSLHDGQVAMIKACRAQSDIVIATIYVNPLRFENREAYAAYPRTPSADTDLLETLKVDFLFAPTDEEIFPDGLDHALTVQHRGSRDPKLESQATIWLKLLNITKPDLVVIGEKDYGQLVALKQVIREFSIDTEVVSIPIVRDVDGVALSGNLTRLTSDQRSQAAILHQTLFDLASAIKDGARNYNKLQQTALIALKGGGFDTRDVNIRDADTWLAPAESTSHLRVSAIVSIGKLILTDNIGIDL
ncbi:MAG: pantoate--beta-alanine ligase [Pseudomonadales bacterium]